MRLITTSYIEQNTKLPKIGRQITAQFDEEGVIVYQAYRPTIGIFAATHGYFGGDFSLTRMSWIKPKCPMIYKLKLILAQILLTQNR